MAQALNGIADGERLLRTGQAYTVLALGRGDQAVAVLSKVNATVIPNGKEPGIHPVGPTLFDAAVRRHWDEVIVPLLRRTATGIAMDMPAFEVSVSNVSAASVQDRPIAIQGYSADAALFLACLSALLTSPVRPDILVTGHVASPSGMCADGAAAPGQIECRYPPWRNSFISVSCLGWRRQSGPFGRRGAGGHRRGAPRGTEFHPYRAGP